MKTSKIITTLIVLTMLLSTMVVLNHLNAPIVSVSAAGSVPGVDIWGTATTDLYYGVTYSTVKINTSTWLNNGTYNLYYPQYWAVTPGIATNFSWEGPYQVQSYPVSLTVTQAQVLNSKTFDTVNAGGYSISFNRAGKWMFGPDKTTIEGYIWVNTSTNYTISLSKTTITYGATDSLDITVNDGGSPVGSMVAVLDPSNHTIYNAFRAAGAAATLDQTDLLVAGDYTVLAYQDKDAYKVTYYYGDENGSAYNTSYGSNYSGVFPVVTGLYTYGNYGPWDPPEVNATTTTFTVDTGVPIMTLTNTSLYWGYYARIDVNITNSTGKGLNDISSLILRHGNTYYSSLGNISTYGDAGNYSITFAAWTPLNNWYWAETLYSGLVNGSWNVVFGWDKDADGTYEWNTSKTFSISGAHPPVRIDLISPSKGKLANTPTYLFGGVTPTTDITFSILGRNLTGPRAYYGDDTVKETWENISVTGDILFPITDATLVHTTNGDWTATVTPTKPDGTITIAVDWPGDDNGSASKTVSIVNGTNVATSVDRFTVGQDVNFTVTVTDVDGAPLKYANLSLVWESTDTVQNMTDGTNAVGKGKNGEYSFWIKHKWMPTTAPDNLTLMVRSQTSGGFWGYAKILVDRNHDMSVNMTPTSGYAGDGTQYDAAVALLAGGHPANSGLSIGVYNSTGAQVTVSGWPITGKYNPSAQEINVPGGTYQIFAFNATHDSAGHNVTLVISNYTVTSAPSVLAWKVDNNTNVTFQVTPSANGTLRLQNMSSNPEGASLGDNTTVDILDGVGTLADVNATELGNITFFFTPDTGSEQPSIGLLRVTTATATPSPANIYINEATTVIITVTHPATNQPISGVWVSLDNNDANGTVLAKIPSGRNTDAAGQVTFALNAQASGNVTIYIENVTDPDNPFVIVAGGRLPMVISLTTPTVNEGDQFTADIKSGSQLVTGVTVTVNFAGTSTTTTTGHVTFTAPSVSTNIPYPIIATALGYADATTDITVLNVPKLIIAVITTPTDIRTGQSLQVAIADDTGTPVIGATVAITGTTITATSGAGGVATLTTPTVTASTGQAYTITASFQDFTTASTSVTVLPAKGIPGFELLTLIVAIGIAFILIRRRRN